MIRRLSWALVAGAGAGSLFLTLGVTGCEQEIPEPQAVEDDETAFDEVQRETGDAVRAAQEWSLEKKEELTAEFNQRMEGLDEEINELGADIEALGDEAQQEWQSTLDGLRDEREEVQQEWDELQEASGDAWDEAKREYDQAFDEFQQAYEDAKARWKQEFPDDVEEGDGGGGGGG